MKEDIIKKIAPLYQRGLSQAEVADELKLTSRRVAYLMTKYGIKTRSRGEAIYLKRNKEGDPFKVKTKLREKDWLLLGLGLGLYWGEGNRVNKNSIKLGNTDPALIKAFLLFLVEIFGIEKQKIKFGLQIFPDHQSRQVLNFWQKILKYPKEHFQKPVLTRLRGKGTYRQKSRYGVLTIYFHNQKLKKILDLYIDKLRWLSKNWKHADVAQLVEQLHGRENCPLLK